MGLNASRLPRGRHFALTWGIPDDFGGMTSALLHRSRAFVRLGGSKVDILTLDDRPDYAALVHRLVESGELIDGMRVVNLWEWLRDHEQKHGARPIAAVERLEPSEGDEVEEAEGVVLYRGRRDADGTLVAADRFRRDGSLLVTDRRFSEAGKARRALTLHTSDGHAVRRWKTTWALYRWWLDRLVGGATSFLVVDSKTAARFVHSYRRDNVVTFHILHGSHRVGGRPGTVRASRADTLAHADGYDVLVSLTARQRDELVADGVTGADIRVIPNGVDLGPEPERPRTRGHGVMLASLTERKRVPHAVTAVAAARRQEGDVTLDVFGDGDARTDVERGIREEGAEGAIRLHGFDAAAKDAFGEADFSLLTSTSEGLPLVLVESMAAGCLPIAYDVRYGPADIISDGENGFLVPDGDTEAMAQRIVELRRMPDARVRAMRHRARVRARSFSDAAVTRRWSVEMYRALEAKRLRAASGEAVAVRLRRRAGVVKRRILRLVSGR